MKALLKRYHPILYWIGGNTIFVSCLYFGLVEGIEGAANIGLTFAWIHSTIGIIFLFSASGRLTYIKEYLKKHNLDEIVRIPKLVDNVLDVVLLGLILWYGHIFLGICYFLSILGGVAVRTELDEWEQTSIMEKLKGNMIE